MVQNSLSILHRKFPLQLELSAVYLLIPRNTNMWGLFDDTIPLLYLAESMCDAFGEGNEEEDPPTQNLKDQLVVLCRTIIYERGVRALHTNDPEGALLNMKKFNQLVRSSYQDKPPGTDQTLGVSWNELGNAYLQNNNSIEAESCFLSSKEAFEALEGATRISISMPLINLGFAALAQGRKGEADEIFSQALADREKEYGSNDKISFV